MPDESPRMNTNNPLKALFSASLIKALLWSLSRVFKTSTTVFSAVLVTRSSNSPVPFCIDFFCNFAKLCTTNKMVFCTAGLFGRIWLWCEMLSIPLGTCLFYGVHQQVISSMGVIITSLRAVVSTTKVKQGLILVNHSRNGIPCIDTSTFFVAETLLLCAWRNFQGVTVPNGESPSTAFIMVTLILA